VFKDLSSQFKPDRFPVAKNKPVKSQQSARQIRREKQRETAADAVPIPVPGLAPASEVLNPSLLVPLYCSMIVLGYLLYARGMATTAGNELSRHQSLFTAVNAATLTGFQQARNPDNYTPFGQALTFILMIAGILFSFLCGGTAVVRITRLRFTHFHLIAWAVGSVFLVAIGGGFALKMAGSDPVNPRSFGDDMFQAISAFGNNGLSLGQLPTVSSAATLLVLLPLSILGGMGLPVLMDLVDRVRGRGKISDHTRTVLSWTAGSYLVLTILLYLVRWPGVNASGSFWRSAFVEASQQAINTRSAGFAFQAVSSLPQAITFLMILAMVIGASSAGTAGGLKVTTLAVLTRGTRDVLGNRPTARVFGAAIVWALIYLGMLAASTVALLITEPEIHLDRTLFLAASALGNVGLSHNPIDASTAGLYVLSITMMLGRIAPVMMLWYLVDMMPEATAVVG
jgi:trk system potassium uptake protein TrkH